VSIFLKTLFQGVSPYNGEVKVVESFGERRLIASSYTQSRSLNKKGKTASYWDGFVNNLPPVSRDGRILILGLAGGTIAKLITAKFGPVAIDGVDIDPLMVDLGRKYLDFKEKNVNVIIADALKFVDETRYKYDIVCVDLFARGDVAVGTESSEFFEKTKRLLTENGVVVVNKLYSTREALEGYLDFLHQIFGKTNVLMVRNSFRNENVIVYAHR